MLYYDRIEIFEGTDLSKTSKSKGFKFQPHVFNGYHDVLMMSMNLSGILNIYGANYC